MVVETEYLTKNTARTIFFSHRSENVSYPNEVSRVWILSMFLGYNLSKEKDRLMIRCTPLGRWDSGTKLLLLSNLLKARTYVVVYYNSGTGEIPALRIEFKIRDHRSCKVGIFKGLAEATKLRGKFPKVGKIHGGGNCLEVRVEVDLVEKMGERIHEVKRIYCCIWRSLTRSYRET